MYIKWSVLLKIILELCKLSLKSPLSSWAYSSSSIVMHVHVTIVANLPGHSRISYRCSRWVPDGLLHVHCLTWISSVTPPMLDHSPIMSHLRMRSWKGCAQNVTLTYALAWSPVQLRCNIQEEGDTWVTDINFATYTIRKRKSACGMGCGFRSLKKLFFTLRWQRLSRWIVSYQLGILEDLQVP